MRILFLGDVVGNSGCSKIKKDLLNQIKLNKIDFVIVNGEIAAEAGVGLTKEIWAIGNVCLMSAMGRTTTISSSPTGALLPKWNGESAEVQVISVLSLRIFGP